MDLVDQLVDIHWLHLPLLRILHVHHQVANVRSLFHLLLFLATSLQFLVDDVDLIILFS